jgi:two-component system, OmpR family, phosphate regulon sensor histidine kinase PhoR
MALLSAQPEAPDARVPALEREFSEFAYIVSHDLAASFRHITGFSDLLARNIEGVPSPDQSIYVGLIRDAAQKCERMLEQLHAYSRVQKATINYAECDVGRILDIVRLQHSSAIKQASGQFAIAPLERVEADPELLTEALGHIVDNAIKFRRTGVAPRVAIEQVPDAKEWKIAVSDNGIGIPEGQEEKLFRMFHRGHPEGAYPGIGSGLTIARRIFRRLGGDVRFVPFTDGACIELSLSRSISQNGGRPS